MKKLIGIIVCIAIFLSQTILVHAAEKPSETELFAKAAVLMDGDSGRILYDKNGGQALANASTTKILTCIIALENCELDRTVEISKTAAAAPKVHLGAQAGQKFLLKDLVCAMMLESFNDCAVAIAEYVAGSAEEFSALMNDYAKKIGCTDTFFITPNGLDAKKGQQFHHTTAKDLALMMRYCIKISPKADLFLKITGQEEHRFSDVEGNGDYHCYNHNAFLKMMDGALSGKTGFTGNAGYCYVGALEQKGKTYIVALLACGWPNNRTYKWSDTKKLMEYGLTAFEKKELDDISISADAAKPIPVKDGQGSRIGEDACVRVAVKKEKDAGAVLLKEGEQITVEYDIADKLDAPVEKGTCVGTVRMRLDGETVREYKVETTENVKKINYGWCLKKVLETAL